MATSTVSRVLRRLGLNRLAWLGPPGGGVSRVGSSQTSGMSPQTPMLIASTVRPPGPAGARIPHCRLRFIQPKSVTAFAFAGAVVSSPSCARPTS